MALHQILAEQVASITDLKRNPMGVIQESESGIVAILNRNQPAFYCITPELFSHIKELIKDLELGRMSNDE
ncbi:stability protein StbD [Haemophilus influenzae]|nr:stability protein StbD [Haemophilus influenzae]